MRENPLLASEKQKNKFGLTEGACAKVLVRMSSCFRALPLVELMLIILLRSRADLQGKLYGDVFAQTCLISFKESSWNRLCHEKYYRKKVKNKQNYGVFCRLETGDHGLLSCQRSDFLAYSGMCPPGRVW